MNKKIFFINLCFFLFLILISSNTVSAQDIYDDEILGFICVFYIIMFIIYIAVGIWVYKDAERRGSSGVLWFIIIIFAGIIGIIIWLILRPPIGGHQYQQGPGSGRMCPNCGRPIPMDARICPYCAKDFQAFAKPSQPSIKYCPHCGTRNDTDAVFCEDCGSQL